MRNRLYRFRIVLVVAFLMGVPLAGLAQYAARITLNSDRSWVTQKVDIRNGYLVSDTGKATIPPTSVKAVEYRFGQISLDLCASYFASSDLATLASVIQSEVSPVLAYRDLPGNLGDYLLWQVRAQFWRNRYTDALKVIALLEEMPSPVNKRLAEQYKALILIERDQLAEAEPFLVSDPALLPAPMAAYIAARVAWEKEDYRSAMKELSRILAFHRRDVEWLPAATALEGKIYAARGQHDKARMVADELMMAYAETRWAKVGEQIKKNNPLNK